MAVGARVVVVHGIGQQLEGEDTLLQVWLPGLRDGLRRTERALIFALKQVRWYFQDPEIRMAVQQRVADAMTNDTRLLIGHSLGSVVAYEALAAHPQWPVKAFVSLGSPLGIRGLIFDRLQPPLATGPTPGQGRYDHG
jgi:pimeloyl-ACP methyl ester carboxylesterase